MARIFSTALLLTLFLYGCTTGGLTPQAPPTLADSAPTQETKSPTESVSTPVILPVSTTEVIPPTELIATLSTPHIDLPQDGPGTPASSSTEPCGYQWAYQDLPELSADFLRSLQGLQPEAQGNAYVFGENCVRQDGSATFLPMETDFNVKLQVNDLANEAELGEWILKVMQVIEAIPPDRIIGPRPGRVSMMFESGGENSGFNFYIDQYRALPEGLSSGEIYQALQALQ